MTALLHPNYFPAQKRHLDECAIAALGHAIPKTTVDDPELSRLFLPPYPVIDIADASIAPKGEGYVSIGDPKEKRALSWIGAHYLIHGEEGLEKIAASFGPRTSLFDDARFAHAYIGLSELLDIERKQSTGGIFTIGDRLEYIATSDPRLTREAFITLAYEHVRFLKDMSQAANEALQDAKLIGLLK